MRSDGYYGENSWYATIFRVFQTRADLSFPYIYREILSNTQLEGSESLKEMKAIVDEIKTEMGSLTKLDGMY